MLKLLRVAWSLLESCVAFFLGLLGGGFLKTSSGPTSWEPFCGFLGPLLGRLKPSWGLSGASERLIEGLLGSWGRLKGVLGPLGGFLGRLKGFLEAFWGLLTGVLKAFLVASSGRLKGVLASWRPLGGLWRAS